MFIKLSISTIFTQYLLFWYASAAAAVSSAINYCGSEVCNKSKQHTLCRFQSSEPAQHCIDHERTVKSDDQKKALLEKLNSRRNKIAAGDVRSFPPAENMIKLEWNEELEKSAQRWADQCIGSGAPDSKDRCRDIGGIPVGQNIASVYGESPGLSPLSLVDVWYIELLNANSTVLPRYWPSSEGGTSHYDYFTQLVWALSSEVGCGGVKFKEPVKDSASIKTRTVHRLVCNFYPSGNVLRETVYSEGPPCSRCPNGGVCDTMYNSLCSLKKMNRTKMPKLTDEFEFAETEILNKDKTLVLSKKKVEEIKTNISHPDDDLKTDDENMTVLDYFSEIYDFTREPLTESTTESTNLCKDRLAVDEFIDLLKKKLTTDPMLKELFLTKQPSQNSNIDSGFTDPSVQAFVSRIYSKKEPSTTTKLPDQDNVNSTLLVDLVEAVIFRSGDKNYASEESKETSESQEVNPVKIQAELAEVKINHEFTGHYFFPEDNNDEPVSETTYTDYDNSNLPVSDVISEIENLKRDKVTPDFLDEIIDFDAGTDESKIRCRRSKLMRFEENGREPENFNHEVRKLRRVKLPMSSYKYDNNIVVKYTDLLKKLASDLRLLNLNDRFHCSSSVNCAVNFKICKNIYVTIVMVFLLTMTTF